MQLKNNEIESYLKTPKSYHPVILIFGPDQGLVLERSETIRKQLLKNNDDPFALINLESDEIADEPARLMDEATTVALFGGERIIRLRLSGRKQITKSIKALLETNNHTAVTIIEADNLTKNNPVRGLIEKAKNAAAIPCYVDDERSLRSMIQDHLQSYNLMANNDAVLRLISLLGENRKTSRNELDKLCLFAEGQNRITLEDIDQLIGDTSSTLIDETIDHILCGNVSAAMQNIQKSKANGQSQVQLILAMQRHLLALQTQVDAYSKGKDIQTIIAKSRPPIHFKRKTQIAKQIKIWSSANLTKALSQLQGAIGDSRKSSAIAEALIENTMLRLSAIANKNAR